MMEVLSVDIENMQVKVRTARGNTKMANANDNKIGVLKDVKKILNAGEFKVFADVTARGNPSPDRPFFAYDFKVGESSIKTERIRELENLEDYI